MSPLEISSRFNEAINFVEAKHVKHTATALYAMMFGSITNIIGSKTEIEMWINNGSIIRIT